MYKVRSTYYWIRSDKESIVISAEKSKILNVLKGPRRLFELSAMLNRDQRAVSRRLSELARMNLVEKVNSNWRGIRTQKRVIVK